MIDNNSVIVNLGGNLSYETGYYVLVEPGAFADLAGNDYAGINEKTVWNFTTISPPVEDVTPLTVASTDPATGALDVPLDKTIIIMFNKEVQASNTAGGIKLHRRDDPASVVSYTYHIEDVVLTIDPETSLEHGVTYTVFIPAGALKDLDNQTLSGDYSFSFTTRTAPVDEVPDEEGNDAPPGGEPTGDETGGSDDTPPGGGVEEPTGPGTGSHDKTHSGRDNNDSSPDKQNNATETVATAAEPTGELGAGLPVIREVSGQVCVFSDLDGHWAEKTVSELRRRGFVSGYPDGTFRPDNRITPGELMAILVRVLRLQPASQQEKSADARDIPNRAIYPMLFGAREGLVGSIIAKNENTAFRAGKVINLAELAVLLAQVVERELGPVTPAEIRFNDTARIPEWAVRPVGVAVAKGVVGGYPDRTFRPRNPATRAEAASMILRLLNAIGIK